MTRRILTHALLEMVVHTVGEIKDIALYYGIPEHDVATIQRGEIPKKIHKPISPRYGPDPRTRQEKQNDSNLVMLRELGFSATKNLKAITYRELTLEEAKHEIKDLIKEGKSPNTVKGLPNSKLDYIVDIQIPKTEQNG